MIFYKDYALPLLTIPYNTDIIEYGVMLYGHFNKTLFISIVPVNASEYLSIELRILCGKSFSNRIEYIIVLKTALQNLEMSRF